MRTPFCPARRPRRGHRGSLLVIVLVMLTVVALAASALFGGLLLGQRRARAAARQEQAEWLLESACQRARYAFASRADYTVETWELPAEAWGGSGTALAKIEVRDGATPSDQATLRVTLTVTEAKVQRVVLLRVLHQKRVARNSTSTDNQN